MKKKIFVSAFALLGVFAMANETDSQNEVKEVSETKEVKTESNLENEAFYPIYYTTSCGVAAVTNQTTWGEEQIMNWAAALEENYC